MESSYKITITKNTFYIQPSAINTYKSNNEILRNIQIIMTRHLEYRLPENPGRQVDEFTKLTSCELNLRLKEIAKKAYEVCKEKLKGRGLLLTIKMRFLEKKYNAILKVILPEFSKLPDELKVQIISYLKFDLKSLRNLCLVDKSSNFIANALKKQLAIEWGYKGEETEDESSKINLYLKEACYQFGVLKILKMDKILVTRAKNEKRGSLCADINISKTIDNFYSLSCAELNNLKENYTIWLLAPPDKASLHKNVGKKIEYLQFGFDILKIEEKAVEKLGIKAALIWLLIGTQSQGYGAYGSGENYCKKFVKIMVRSGADPNAWSGGSGVGKEPSSRPLYYALTKVTNFEEMEKHVEALLENGADPNLMQKGGMPPLHFVIRSKFNAKTKKRLIQLLIKHGADPNLLENGKTWQQELKEHPENKKYFFSTGKWPENMPKNALALAINCREYGLTADLI
jgi:hypothetical protein